MTEREHAEKVADAWVATVETHRRIFEREKLVAGLADLIEREQAAAWLDGRSAGLDAARQPFDDIVAIERKERDAAIARAEQAERERDEARDMQGLANRSAQLRGEKLERAEAAAAQMRAALADEADPFMRRPEGTREKLRAALATNVGTGYASPEQHARAVAEARRQALRQALAAIEAGAKSVTRTMGCGICAWSTAADAIRALLGEAVTPEEHERVARVSRRAIEVIEAADALADALDAFWADESPCVDAVPLLDALAAYRTVRGS